MVEPRHNASLSRSVTPVPTKFHSGPWAETDGESREYHAFRRTDGWRKTLSVDGGQRWPVASSSIVFFHFFCRSFVMVVTLLF